MSASGRGWTVGPRCSPAIGNSAITPSRPARRSPARTTIGRWTGSLSARPRTSADLSRESRSPGNRLTATLAAVSGARRPATSRHFRQQFTGSRSSASRAPVRVRASAARNPIMSSNEDACVAGDTITAGASLLRPHLCGDLNDVCRTRTACERLKFPKRIFESLQIGSPHVQAILFCTCGVFITPSIEVPHRSTRVSEQRRCVRPISVRVKLGIIIGGKCFVGEEKSLA